MAKQNFDSYMRENGNIDLTGDEFINRELSWLDFNERILKCASKKIHPLNERMNFLAISSSNLDEFISVRFGTILDGDKKDYDEVLKGISDCVEKQESIFLKLKDKYARKGVFISPDMKKVPKSIKKEIRNVFNKLMFPVITPINVGSTNEPPNILSAQLCVAVTIYAGDKEELSIIPIPNSINKIYRINKFVFSAEDIILECIDELFINKKIISKGCFKMIKNGNIILNHDSSSYIIERMSETIKQRDFSQPIFMQVNADMNKRLRNILANLFDINKKQVMSDRIAVDYTKFMGANLCTEEGASYKPYKQNVFEDDEEDCYSLFSTIKERDFILQHPYDSFNTVIKFLEHAAIDPDVVSIKQCLYRVSSVNSPIIKALIKAAENGKQVTVLVEIKARFDESRNIALIEKMKYAGINVVLGLEHLKTHCKICIVMRKENDEIKVYSHLGTGNYNDKTAKIYTDISYFTANQKIGRSLLDVFNILSGISAPDSDLAGNIYYSPVTLRTKINKMIDKETENAKKGKSAKIILKLNSLSDEDMVKRLYKAASKGVKIYIICRGICSIKPKKNIYIKSIVGRFLEHSRIYYFKNGNNPEYYISSADLLTRNLDRRVEVLVRLDDKEVQKNIQYILDVMIRDEKNSFIMYKNGKYKYKGGDFDCHQWFIDNASKKLKMKIPKNKK